MAKCNNCQRAIPDGATFCGHCGKPTGVEPTKVEAPFTQYNVVAHEPTPQQNDENATTAANKTVNENYNLSVAGFVMAFFNPFVALLSLIICSVAVGKRQAKRGLAIFGLTLSIIQIVIALAIGITYAVLMFYVFPKNGMSFADLFPWLQK